MNGWKVMIGRRKQQSSAYAKAITDAVAAAEKHTNAALAVSIHASSGNYRDVAYLFAAVVAWCALLVILFLPHTFADYFVLVDVALVFALAAWICSRSRLRRWLTTRHRRYRQVRTAAEAVFVQDGVLHAPGRTGVLIYWSRLERQVEVVADIGLLKAVPAEQWHAFLFDLKGVPSKPHPATALLERIQELGQLLATYLPASDNHHHRFPKRYKVEQ